MARRHIMTLRVGDDTVEVETNPEPPAGYGVQVWRYRYGGARTLIFDELRSSTKLAAELFARKCRETIDDLAATESAGVVMAPTGGRVEVRPDDSSHRDDRFDENDVYQ